MIFSLSNRILSTVDPKCLAKMAWNFGFKGARSVMLFKKRMKQGIHFPPFLYLSILNSCNLRCQGCWVDVEAPRNAIDLDTLNRTVNDAREHGNSFFGILGGEPFMHPELLDFLAQHPDCYFQVFTNGQLITEKAARALRQIGNVTPLISIEGTKTVSDERRGNKDVLNRTLRGLQHCLEQKLLTGVATSLCQTNLDDLLSEAWLDKLIDMGVHYTWYHTYRPVGPKINEQLALNPEQINRARRFIVNMRARKPIAIVDAYYDHAGQALCPMATGISHHVSPKGSIEPCPIIQFATEDITDKRGLFETFTNSAFLADFRKTSAEHTRGCVVLERPDVVKQLVLKHGAKDTTVRQTAIAELDRMSPRPSQWVKEENIPEKHWMYWVAKRFFYTDFGVYKDLKA
ncbi:MoaA/NifB/PqqE/SkfB family radical SAM enzyme [Roseimicrobium gellanilyticum]|uniref:MoaA/NifB/PqqE/SkfB family radical SAM enzyme n=1 Tax=Roseimicrobium gellanilyticum TaxID=748857 RepID=A0A366HSU4_9BACT|nr:radical SAM/SPASM domain-containing protein [Roseimicrobium gellanilyticum]RBP47346.1 MoaA/NifB/PqqE/SkfB family radical SAM enzyme [Roseimicrobium gellanilyticum]